jgi:diadenosine tetraphosphate (Ap4A) HIT family hydrolase
MECLTCKSVSGEKRISPGSIIYEGKYWTVEHAYPVKVKGWLVIVLKRHIESLHDLSSEEFIELSKIQWKVIKLLYKELKSEKEYVSCYAEKEQYRHIHFHVFAKPYDLPIELRGAKSFAFINATEAEAIPKEEIIALCNKLHDSILEIE